MSGFLAGRLSAMSFRGALALLITCQVTLLATTGLPWRTVVFPHGNSLEVGAGPEAEVGLVNNRKFSDQSSSFIPVLREQLQGNRSRWISTWNPHEQLGRPLPQLSGTGKAYPLTHAFSLFVSDPLRLYSLLFLATLMMSGLFMLLFLRELSLLPIACFVGAMGVSFSVYFLYWATFLLTVSGICWTIALLWLITKFLRDGSFLSAVGVSFCVYALLLSGYPQHVVLFGYLLLVYGAVSLRRLKRPFGEKARLAAILFGCGVIAVVAALPVYADVYEAAHRSSRLKADLDFFLAILPRFRSFSEVLSFIAKTVSPFTFGNPIQPKYPFHFNGVGFGVFSFWLFVLSVLTLARRLWLWHLFVALCFVATVSVPVYVFLNGHMGFHISRCIPTVGAVIPFFVAGSYAVDALCKGEIGKKTFLMSVALTLFFAVLIPLLAVARNLRLIDVRFVLVDLCLIAIIVFSFVNHYRAGIVIATLLSSVIASQSLLLVRSHESIRFSSFLVDRVRAYTDNGNSRFAKVGGELASVIPPSQESLYGIKSIHSYDSLSSKNFQVLASRISRSGTRVFGRWFEVLDTEERLCNEETALMGISIVLSKRSLAGQCLSFLAEVEGVKFYRPFQPPLRELQTSGFSNVSAEAVAMVYREGVGGGLPVVVKTSLDDLKVFRTTPAEQTTLLFLSEQYHPRWEAYADGVALQTVVVNGFFLGVLVPPQTVALELRFLPFVIWSWIPQFFYGGMILAGVVHRFSKRQFSGSQTTGPIAIS